MPKQEYKILNFEGGTNNKFDPRDIAENQNALSQFSINKVGRLVKEGDAKNLYSKTDLNGHAITDITSDPSTGGFTKGYGLFSFSHDYDMEGDEVDTEFICINDANGIDIYDPNQSTEWQANKLYVGSRVATVKPEYYNVDGALRVCDSNFQVTDTAFDTAANIAKNDITISIDNGAGGNVTLASGAIIQIDQEIMYIPTGATGTSFSVIRGFANTKATTHANNTNVYYVNVPKYFGHIKANRLFECATSNSINVWAEDIQTPQPPNNTRKSDGTTATLALSAGVQSLRVYNEMTSSTTNIPTESEKVVLEFQGSEPDYGIIKVDMTDGSDFITLTTSADHGLIIGDTIDITNLTTEVSGLQGLAGIHEVAGVGSNTIDIEIVDHSITADANWSTTAEYAAIVGGGWADYKDSVAGTVKAQIDADEVQASGKRWVHITGITGVESFNGIKLTTRVDDNEFYFSDANHADAGSAGTGGKVQQLLALVTRPGEDAIEEGLKRKWNFAMSFTYDGPGQEVQESLLTQGYKITELAAADGTANELAGSMNNTDSSTAVAIDDGDGVLVNDDVVMIGSEQMLVTNVSGNTVTFTRGYNNSTKATHSSGDQILLVEELTPTATIDWTSFSTAPKCVIKSVYGYGTDEKSWNPRINGFKIYMKDVTKDDGSDDWRLFSEVKFNSGTYTLFGAGNTELILEQPEANAIATNTKGISINSKPVNTYLSENLFTEQTIIDAQYKASCVAGRKVYIGNIRQGGRTYPDRMLRSPINKFDTFPETNFIDVAIGDGDSITALESFGDRILQYKKNKLYVINISGESEVLEAEYINAGVAKPSQIAKTNVGIAWVNPSGLWFFDGQQAVNLTRQVEKDTYPDHNDHTGIIGFDNKTNRIIYTPRCNNSGQTVAWYIYDLELQAYQAYTDGSMFPHSDSGANFYTNIINDSNGNMIVGYVDQGTPTEINFYQWDSSAGEGQSTGTPNMFKSKDIDLASPAMRKKVYKVYVTYKCSGHSGIQMKYATDGSGSFTGTFSSSTSTNYDADSFTSNGTHTGFKNTNGAWAVAELIPTSSINNIKSIQFSLDHILIAMGTAQAGGGTSSIKLASGASATAGIYNDYNIYIYTGPARYNTRIIENGTNGTAYSPDGSSQIATVLNAFTDKGYGNDADSTSTKYILGAVATDFEINDITIVYRAKPVK